MTLHAVRLSEGIEAGAVGGPQFKVTVNEVHGGFQYRNLEWDQSIAEWDLSFVAKENSDFMNEIVSFFYARRGPTYAFLFRDWTDYQFSSNIGSGDGLTTEFQVTKTYGAGTPAPYVRKLYKPSGITVTVDGVENSDYTISSSGLITFDSAPASGVIAVSGTFDVPVRFVNEKLNIQAESKDYQSATGVIIREQLPDANGDF